MFRLIKFLIEVIGLVVLALILIVIFNPWNLRGKLINTALEFYFNNQTNTEEITTDNETSTTTVSSDSNTQTNVDQNPLLSAEQEATLESLGVDVSILPTEITPEMQDCFIQALGEERVVAIMNGDTPSALELFKAKSCL